MDDVRQIKRICWGRGLDLRTEVLITSNDSVDDFTKDIRRVGAFA